MNKFDCKRTVNFYQSSILRLSMYNFYRWYLQNKQNVINVWLRASFSWCTQEGADRMQTHNRNNVFVYKRSKVAFSVMALWSDRVVVQISCPATLTFDSEAVSSDNNINRQQEALLHIR